MENTYLNLNFYMYHMFEIDSWLIRDLVSKPNFLALQRGDDKLQIRSREERDLIVGTVH